MESLPYFSVSHKHHDDMWCMVSPHHQLPICIACIIERLGNHSLSTVEKQFNLSTLASIQNECDEVTSLLQQHPLVCQHIIDIITENLLIVFFGLFYTLVEQYTDITFLALSVDILVKVLDTLQSEEMYVYLLDKFKYKMEHTNSTVPLFFTLIGKMAVISSVYILTLIHTHEPLLTSLLDLEYQVSCGVDEATQCSMLFLLICLFDDDILPVVPPQIFFLVEKHLLHWLSSAHSLDLQMNTLALLKKVLQSDICLMNNKMTWVTLSLGLKRMFVSKKEVLQTAATQCLTIIAANPKHFKNMQLILQGDLPEFLFESLHTINGTQLKAVLKCLQLFAEHDLFFKCCHSVYGIESVLRAIDIAFEMQNVPVLDSGYSLLAGILEKQPDNIPLFVNKTTSELALSVIIKGVKCHPIQVVLASVKSAAAFFRETNRQKPLPFKAMEDILEEVCIKFGELLNMGNGDNTILHTLDLKQEQLLAVLLSLITAFCRECIANNEDSAKLLQLTVHACTDLLIPYFVGNLTECENNLLKGFFICLNILFERQMTSLLELSQRLLFSGFMLHILKWRSELRNDSELLNFSSMALINVFTFLMKYNLTECQSLPVCVQKGLEKLYFQTSIHQTLSHIEDEDTGLALCMIVYIICLEDTGMFSAVDIVAVLNALHVKFPNLMALHPLASRFLLFLSAWSSFKVKIDSPDCLHLLHKLDENIVGYISQLPVHIWATLHSTVFIWLFSNQGRALKFGSKLMEHWILLTRGNFSKDETAADSSHIFCILFHMSDFRFVLVSLLATASEDISYLAKDLFLNLLSIVACRAEEESESSQKDTLFSQVYEDVAVQFLNLFLQPLQPARSTISNFLQLMTSLLQLTKHRAVDFTRRVKIIYHVVKFTASLNEDEHELMCHSLACLYNLTTCAHIEDDKNVPILLQNPGFLSHMEYCLTAKQQKLSLSALSLISVMVSCCPDYSISRPISINADFILEMVTWRCSEATVPALKILYLSLETSLSGAKTILSFYRTGNILENGPLFSHRELRQLYCYVQQYLCQENKDIQSYAAKCLLKIMDYSFATNSILGNHFLHHPWHHQLLKSILAQSAQNGLSLCIAEFSNKIWCTDEDSDPEAAKLLLESVMATELFSNNQDTFIKLVNKAKQFCADSSLLKQVESKLSLWAKDNPVSHSSI